MSERENIRPLNESLAISYGLSGQEAAARLVSGESSAFEAESFTEESACLSMEFSSSM
jgi:hypothetical protein